MKDPTEIEIRLLEGAVESWIPLWEAVCILRPVFPDQKDADIVPSARVLIGALVDRDLIDLAWLSGQGASVSEDVVPKEKIAPTLTVDANWWPTSTISNHIS
jgi:hypothetical protein